MNDVPRFPGFCVARLELSHRRELLSDAAGNAHLLIGLSQINDAPLPHRALRRCHSAKRQPACDGQGERESPASNKTKQSAT